MSTATSHDAIAALSGWHGTLGNNLISIGLGGIDCRALISFYSLSPDRNPSILCFPPGRDSLTADRTTSILCSLDHYT